MQVALAFFEAFSPIYTVIFVIVRTLIGPPAVVWLSMRLVDTPGLPPAVRCGSPVTFDISCTLAMDGLYTLEEGISPVPSPLTTSETTYGAACTDAASPFLDR